jgi:hypothetical protein
MMVNLTTAHSPARLPKGTLPWEIFQNCSKMTQFFVSNNRMKGDIASLRLANSLRNIDVRYWPSCAKLYWHFSLFSVSLSG